MITLRGRGVPRLRSTTRGDLHVHVEVRTPTRLDETQEKLLRELAELRNEDIGVGRQPRRAVLQGARRFRHPLSR